MENYDNLQDQINALRNKVVILEKSNAELAAMLADHENILRPGSLCLPHPSWDFEYHNTIDVLKGLLQKICIVFQIDLDKNEKVEEFNF